MRGMHLHEVTGHAGIQDIDAREHIVERGTFEGVTNILDIRKVVPGIGKDESGIQSDSDPL